MIDSGYGRRERWISGFKLEDNYSIYREENGGYALI